MPLINIKWTKLLYNTIQRSDEFELRLYMQASYDFKSDTAPKWSHNYGIYDFL